MPTPRSVATSEQPHQDLCVLLSAEQLGRHAEVRHDTNGGFRSNAAGDAWFQVELAIATGDPNHITQVYKALCRARRGDLPEVFDANTRLLDVYLPSFEERTRRSMNGAVPKAQRGVGRLLAPMIDADGYPTNPSDGKLRGRIGELVALSLIHQGFPASPREESSADSKLNHDCYSWDGSTKVPVQIKYRHNSNGASDRRVFPLHLGPLLHEVLSRPYYEELVADNEAFHWTDERTQQEAAIAIVALAIARDSQGIATRDQRKLVNSLRGTILERLRQHKRRYPVSPMPAAA